MSELAASGCTLTDRAKPAFDIASLDLARCHSLEVNTALNEWERAHKGLSHRIDTWPVEVQQRITREVERWLGAHPTAGVRLVSSGIHNGVAVLVLHYAYPPPAAAAG